MTVIHLGNNFYQGLSTDTKPTNIPDNSEFYETDTYTSFRRVSGAWKELSPVNVDAEYTIYKVSSSLYKAKNNTTGIVEFTDSTPDAAALTNSVLSAYGFLAGRIKYSNDTLDFQQQITLSGNTAFQARPWFFEGHVSANSPVLGTVFNIGSSFTDGNFLFESVNAGASGNCTCASWRNINFRNSYAKTTTPGTNVSGGATEIDAGFINIENDTQGPSPRAQIVIENCTFQYGWRCIRLAGYIWWVELKNLAFTDSNVEFVGDYDIQIENGTGHADRPKGFTFDNVRSLHTAGNSGGNGNLDNSFVFCGGYHNINNVFVNGIKYNQSAIALKQCFSSTFNKIQALDLIANGSTVAALVLDTVSPEGDVATANYSTFNNRFTNLAVADVNKSITFLNSPFRNWIHANAYWGGVLDIDDTAAGIENTIELVDGQQPSATANSKIVLASGTNIRVIDKRKGAYARNISTQSGDGSTKVFNIAHSCFGTPAVYKVEPITPDAFGTYTVTIGSSNITITYIFAPPSGTDNLKWAWSADLYT